ncbi:MAG: glutamate 5-kinase [Myxococcales bacterium]|nr:MAG: glutamate 5-kinase [Myxococcales bacterium]
MFRFDPKKLKRIVIKIGSSSIVGQDGAVRLGFLGELVALTGERVRNGAGVVLVTSGAIAMGFTRLGFAKRPADIPSRQACAAAGQTELMALYQTLFSANGQKAAQVLLTRDDIEDRRRYLNAREALSRLLALGLVPIINENDTVAVEEIVFGDNDRLSALVAGLVDADLLVLLTDVDGLCARPPANGEKPEVIRAIDGPLENLGAVVGRAPQKLGSGGMVSKLEAAKTCREYGIPCVIARSSGEALTRVLDGEEEGTFVAPLGRKILARERWLLRAAGVQGTLVVDDGAAAALRAGKSLLPRGIAEAAGQFARGAVVEVKDESGAVVARGLARYAASDLRAILGKNTREIESILGYTYGSEAIHRDSLVLINGEPS